MYDFLLREDFWVDAAIVAALITGGAGLVGVFISSMINKLAKDVSDIKKHEGLSKEHESLSKGHENLSNQQKDILNKIDLSKDTLFQKMDKAEQITYAIKDIVSKDELRYDNLTDKQKLMMDSINNLNQLASELKHLQEDNTRLIKENQDMKIKCSSLVSDNIRLQSMLQERSNDLGLDDEVER